MTLSPLPEHQRKRKFHLFHGELLEADDFEDDEEEEGFDETISADDAEGAPEAKSESQSEAGTAPESADESPAKED
jgi:hypothetical protein